MTLILLFIASYLLGAMPFGYWIALACGVDITKAGSGNIGATNVKRVLGERMGRRGEAIGYLVFVLDVLKSLVPTLVARALVTGPVGLFDAQFIWFAVGLAAVLGHCVSPFLGFKGGKGISTALGAILGAGPVVALLCFALFLAVILVTRYMSVASVVAVTAVIPFSLIVPGQSGQLLPIFAILAIFVAYRHRKNFHRLKMGTEPRFYFKRKEESERIEGPEARSAAEVEKEAPVL